MSFTLCQSSAMGIFGPGQDPEPSKKDSVIVSTLIWSGKVKILF